MHWNCAHAGCTTSGEGLESQAEHAVSHGDESNDVRLVNDPNARRQQGKKPRK